LLKVSRYGGKVGVLLGAEWRVLYGTVQSEISAVKGWWWRRPWVRRQRELGLVGGFGWRAILFSLSLDEQFRAAGLWRGIGLSTIRGGSGGLL